MRDIFYPTLTGNFLVAVRICYRKDSENVYEWRCSKCSEDEELWPAGSIIGRKQRAAAFQICGCSLRPSFTRAQKVILARRKAFESGFEFLDFEDGKRQYCVLKCKEHGLWNTTSYKRLMAGAGCRKCAQCKHGSLRIYPETFYIERLKEKLKRSNFTYQKRLGDYLGARSEIVLHCSLHGEFKGTYHYAYLGASSCRGCANRGYNSKIRGTLYLIKSDCGAYLKVGITNKLDNRLRDLKRSSPFSFELISKWSAGGRDVLDQEKAFHSSFESAGFRGFPGSTEWLKADPAIVERFSLLPGALSTPDSPFADALAALG